MPAPPRNRPATRHPRVPVRELTVEVDGQSYAVRITGGLDSATGPSASSAPAATDGARGHCGVAHAGPAAEGEREGRRSRRVGDVVCVLEAMKMQNDIEATRAGTITDVYVKEGVVVGPRAPLVQIGA